jgi:nucleoid-associated protein YgaU
MANKIEVTNINQTNSLTSKLSRYNNSKVLRYGNKNVLTFNMYKKKDNVPTSQDKFTVITSGNEFRPDKVSKEVYGTPNLWWKIMEANNISDIFNFKAGITIRLPFSGILR